MIQGHGGNIYALAKQLGCRPEDITDVSSNINPLGPPPGLMDYLKDQLAAVCVLPEVDSRTITGRMAQFLGVDYNGLLAAAGTTQLIYTMFDVLASQRVLIVGPTYADYADACRMAGVEPQYFLTDAEDKFQPDLDRLAREAIQADTVVICNPNNPTGVMIPGPDLKTLCRSFPDTRFVIDESYLAFVPAGQAESMVTCGLENVIVLHSLSKIYRLPGLRIGFLIAAAPVIKRFQRVMPPWRLNSLAQAACRFVMDNPTEIDRFVVETRRFISAERARFIECIGSAGKLVVYPSCASYLLIQLPDGFKADKMCRRFEQQKILVRNCSNFHGLDDRFIRIALNLAEVNDRVADVIRCELNP